MKCKHLRLIMELIFIFILPFLVLCMNITIENDYVYDNVGNFESAEKKLSYSGIVYTDVASPLVELKTLLCSTLNVDINNVVVSIVFDYNTLWLTMFIIWHFVYKLFDWIVHLIDRGKD